MMMAIFPANTNNGHDFEILKHLVDHSIVFVMKASECFEGRTQWFGTFDGVNMNFLPEFTL